MGKSLQAADNSQFIAFPDLGLSPIALSLGPFDLRWYSLAYLAGIFIGYWYLLKLTREPGAPMARRHADDLVFYAALGIILGGRLGYVLFYKPALSDFSLCPSDALYIVCRSFIWQGAFIHIRSPGQSFAQQQGSKAHPDLLQ